MPLIREGPLITMWLWLCVGTICSCHLLWVQGMVGLSWEEKRLGPLAVCVGKKLEYLWRMAISQGLTVLSLARLSGPELPSQWVLGGAKPVRGASKCKEGVVRVMEKECVHILPVSPLLTLLGLQRRILLCTLALQRRAEIGGSHLPFFRTSPG